VNLDPQLLKILQEEYTHWKELPDGRIAAVCAGFTYGKARIMVGIDYIGYSDAY
jgi:2-phosphoglycerate kinase